MIPQSLARRYLVFTLEDENALCDLLVEHFPNLRFADELGNLEAWAEERPNKSSFSHVRSCLTRRVEFFFTQPGWQLEYERAELPQGPTWMRTDRGHVWPNGYWWRRGVHDEWTTEYRQGKEVLEPPMVGTSEIVFRARRDVPEDVAVVKQALRLVRKVATNKCIEIRYNRPGQPRTPLLKGGMNWFGHHALAWARQNPERVLGPAWNHRTGEIFAAYRPLD